MALITWTAEQYGTKVDICDSQHKTLFGLLNDLHELANGNDRKAIGSKLDALISFVVEHFKTEEKLMQEKGYSLIIRPCHPALANEGDDVAGKIGEDLLDHGLDPSAARLLRLI